MKIKKTIVISSEIWDQVKGLSDNFSALVENALIEYLRQKRVENAKRAFGSWVRDRKSVEIVEELRADESRKKVLNFDWY